MHRQRGQFFSTGIRRSGGPEWNAAGGGAKLKRN